MKIVILKEFVIRYNMDSTGKVMKWAELIFVFLSLFSIISTKYQLSTIEIRPDPSGEPAKIFTDEEISKYDGSDVSTVKLHTYITAVRDSGDIHVA